MTYLCSAMHLSITYPVKLPSSASVKTLSLIFRKTFLQFHNIQKVHNTAEILFTNTNFSSAHLPPLSITCFLYSPASTNHFNRTYLCRSCDTATALLYSAEQSHGCPSQCALYHESLWIALLQTIYPHAVPFCNSVPPPQQRCDLPSLYYSTSDRNSPGPYPRHSVLAWTPYTVEKRTMIHYYIFRCSDWTTEALWLPRKQLTPHRYRLSTQKYFAFSCLAQISLKQKQNEPGSVTPVYHV